MNTEPKMIPKQVILAILCEIRHGNVIKDFFIEKHMLGIFRPSSHIQHNSGEPKVKYGHYATAEKAAQRMSEKYGKTFNPYKCAYCDGYHIGKPKRR